MEITPWNVEGDLDYEKLIKKFGTSVLTDELHGRLKTPMPPALARGMCFSHRDLDKWLDAYERGENVSVITGRGPSNKMHIGHLTLYALPLFFQQQYGCNVYIPISDDEKFLVKRDLDFETVQKHAKDNIIDILAMGFDPDKTFVFRDFESKDIYKYSAQVAKHINYSTARAIFGLKPEQNIGWSFYPAVQATHILYPQFIEGPHETLVPIGIDQDPFMRLTRDVAGKFGFRKPAALHKRLAPGLSGPKMNSSGGKAIWLSDDEKTVRKKIMKHAFSGGQVTTEKHRRLGGNPDIDVSFQYLRYLFEDSDEKLAEIEQSYRSGEMLSGELKQYLVDNMNEYLATHRKRRVMVEKNLDKFLME